MAAAGANVLGEAVVEITGDDAKLRASLDKAKQLTLGQELKANFMSGMSGRDLAIGMAAGYGAVSLLQSGISGLVEFTKSSIKEFAEEEKTLMGMQAVLSATDKNAVALTRDFAAWSEQTERVTSLTHDQVEALILQAKMYGVATPQLKAMTQASIGLAKATGMDATGALHALTLAMSGEWMMLGRRSAAIRTAITDADKFRELQKLITTGMTAEAAQVNSTSGSFDQLGKSWAILKEQFGEGVAKKLEPFVWAMTQINREAADSSANKWLDGINRGLTAVVTSGISEEYLGIAKWIDHIRAKHGEIAPMELERLEYNKAITAEMRKQAGHTGKVGDEYKAAQAFILQNPSSPSSAPRDEDVARTIRHHEPVPGPPLDLFGKGIRDPVMATGAYSSDAIRLLTSAVHGIESLVSIAKEKSKSVFSGK